MTRLNRTRISYLTPLHFDEASYIGGGERFPLNLAHGVVAASGGRCEVDVVSYGERATELALGPGVTLRVLAQANRPPNPLDALSWGLPEAIADADIVHVHQIFTRSSEVALLVAKQQGKPTCLMDHGGGSSTVGLTLGILELADRLFSHTDFAASLLRTRRPVHVLRGGVDAGFFRPPESTPVRDRVLYVGRLLPHKGIDRLIAALPGDMPLTVCGRAYDESYNRFLRALAVGKDVRFVTGADDEELRELYRRAWATVLPSVYKDCFGRVQLAPELLGLSLLESMACGTPAICSRVGGMPELVHDGETGFVFDSLAQLSEQLESLRASADLVERMGASARGAVERQFSREVAGARALSVYDEMLTGPERPLRAEDTGPERPLRAEDTGPALSSPGAPWGTCR